MHKSQKAMFISKRNDVQKETLKVGIQIKKLDQIVVTVGDKL